MVNPGYNSGVFSGRQSFLTFKDYLSSATQGWISFERKAVEMARTQYAVMTNIENLPHIGLQLPSYHLSPGDAVWLTAAQSGNLSAANGATLAPNMETFDAFAQQTISGVTYADKVQSSGFPMNVARPSASTNWTTTNIAGDQTAFPPPNPSEDNTPMQRVLRTPDWATSRPTGSVEPWDNLMFHILAPSSAITPRQTLATLYFNGPAGDPPPSTSGTNLAGSGRYALKVRGDGFAYLYELSVPNVAAGNLTGTWIPRYNFMWNYQPNTAVSWTVINIGVNCRMWMDSNGNYLGDRITFAQTSASQTPGQLNIIQNMAELAILNLRLQKGHLSVYAPPVSKGLPLTKCAVRMDLAMDCRASFATEKHVYKASGSLIDDFVSFEQPLTADTILTLCIHGALKTGCTWSGKLYDNLNNPLVMVAGSDGTKTSKTGQTWTANFHANANMTSVQPEIDLGASSDGFRSPTVTQWAIYGEPVYQTNFGIAPVTVPNRSIKPSLWESVIESVSINPQQSDPGAENATIVVNDLTGELQFLEQVNMIPVYLWMVDPDINTNPSGGQVSLFRGYCLVADGERLRTYEGQQYPSEYWTRWTLHCVGEWSRVMDATLPSRQTWIDFGTFIASKVTDIVRNMHSSVFVPEMVQVFDSNLRLFGLSADTWTAEPGTRVGDLTNAWIKDFFGGWNLFDESAGAKGMMRSFPQKTAPYNNLAIFEMDHPTMLAGDGLPRIPQYSASYGTSIASNGQHVQHTFMQAGTFKPHLERAEGNCVIVRGGGVGPDAIIAGGADACMFTQMAINVNSFNFLNLSPSDPHYPTGNDPAFFGRLIPIRVFNYTLPNQAAVDWYCRRIFDKACYARYFLSFVAPMIDVIDSTDAYQVRPRRLRYYDPVLVRQYNGTLSQFLVVGCMPAYTKDNIQMAHYLLVTQQNISERAVIPLNHSDLSASLKAQLRIQGIDMTHLPSLWSFQKQGVALNSEIMALPTLSNLPLQQLDPTKPNFGKFFFLNNYSINGDGDPIR